MGSHDVKIVSSHVQRNKFTKYLLRDIQALERMIEGNMFTETAVKIGAEQEICLVDKHFKPAPIAMEILAAIKDPAFTTELAKFNLEVNLDPLDFTGDCFSSLHNTLDIKLASLQKLADSHEVNYILTGILPSLRKFDLELDNLTPLKRYTALIKALGRLRGNVYELKIKGIDELNLQHDSAMLEACNTSFQVHLQVDPDNFVEKYNAAQVLAAPILAISANSPLLFGKRLWNETRIALFQQSLDTRLTSEHLRDRSPRVMFGNRWVDKSVLEIYREDITRFRIMLMTEVKGDCIKDLEEGIIPELSALNIHNSTVYRWNRPCIGMSSDGKPHLRIENRILPSGPTVIDEVANAAFWLGMMNAFDDHYPGIKKLMDFDTAKFNFLSTAFNGLESEMKWFDHKKSPVSEIIKKELLPIAREGLEKNNVNKEDIDKYLEVIEERNEIKKNGSSWILNSYSNLMKEDLGREEMPVAITAGMLQNSKLELPVHKWPLAKIRNMKSWHPASILVEEFMTTDLFTVHKDDIPELVADMMDWQKIRYMPVEDEKGKLIGLISSRMLMRYFSNKVKLDDKEIKTVDGLMITNPITISPESTIFDAMYLFKEHSIGCLPVVKRGNLVGIVTEGNFMGITKTLLKVLEETDSET